MRTFNVGDVVRVKEAREIRKYPRLTSDLPESYYVGCDLFIFSMFATCGKLYRIDSKIEYDGEHKYRLVTLEKRFVPYNYTDEMLKKAKVPIYE